MAEFIAKVAFGFISDKLRDYAAKKLQDGGLTDEKFKGYIIRELREINSKLDAISRRELSASISALQQGILRLLDMYGTARANSTETRSAQVSITVDDAVALAFAVERMKILSHDLFEEARECFKQAGMEARRAFHNTALSIEERIHANKVRMTSTILEHLDQPEVAATDCLLFLEELHAMPAIQKMFSVHVKGGIKSLFKKDSRRESIKAVTMMNLNLSDFITKFTGRRMAVLHWPMVYCDKLVVHPIHYSEDCFNEMKKMGITPPWDVDLLHEMLKRIAILRRANASNSRIRLERRMERRDSDASLCCVPYRDNTQRGRLKLHQLDADDIRSLCLSPVDLYSSPHCVAVDEDDYVYVLQLHRQSYLRKTLPVQIYHGNGVCVNDIALTPPFSCFPFALVLYTDFRYCEFYLGKDEEDQNLIFCFLPHTPLGLRKAAGLHDNNGNVLLSFPTISMRSDKCVLVSENKRISIPMEHFFHKLDDLDANIAFVYTLENQFKGIVDLRPNHPDSPSTFSLWDRYLSFIHVMADGKTLRCLHSR